MRLASLARRSVAVTAATALLTSGGVATGLLVGTAAAQFATSASPNVALNTATASVDIKGTGFTAALVSDVSFVPQFTGTEVGDIAASVDYQKSGTSSTDLWVNVPLTLAAPGVYSIKVTQSGSTATCNSCFTVVALGPANATSSTVGVAGSTSRGAYPVDVKGNTFAKGAKVQFLGSDAATLDPKIVFTPGNPNNTGSTGYPSSSLIQGNIATLAGFVPGKHYLRVVNTDNDARGALSEFWQPSFVAGGVSPNAVGQGAKDVVVTVTSTGKSFREQSQLGIQNLASSGSDITVGPATVAADGSTISAKVTLASNASTADRAVTVIGPDGGRYTVPAAFHATAAPALTSLSPATLGQGAHTLVTVTGTGFATGTSKPTVTFSATGVTGTVQSVTSSTQLVLDVVVAPDATVGGSSVTLRNPDGGTSTKGADTFGAFPFNVGTGPTVSAASPAALPPNASTSVTFTGTDLNTGTGGVTVEVLLPDGTVDPKVTVGTVSTPTSPTPAPVGDGVTQTFTAQLTTLTGATDGPRDIRVTNADDKGRTVCTGCLSVNALTVSPAGAANSNTAAGVTVTAAAGTSLTGATLVQLTLPNSSGFQQPITGTGVVVAGDGKSLTATFDLKNAKDANGTPFPAAPGSYGLVVTTPAGTLSCSACYSVAAASAPAVTAISPNAGGQGATDRSVTVTGSGFANGMQLVIDGVTAHDVTLTSTTTFTALLDIASDASTGARDVVVQNTAGTKATLANGFTVNAAPTVKSIAPAALGAGAQAQKVTVTGPGYATGSTLDLGPDVTVTVTKVTDNKPATPLSSEPDDTIEATVTIAQDATLGARDVVVRNTDGGQGALAGGFTVNAGPVVSSVTPAGIKPGVTTAVTITGHDFAAGAVPTVDSGDVTFTDVTVAADGLTIAAKATPANSTLGFRVLRVTNPTDKGSGTCSTCFAVANPPTAPRSLVLVPQDRQVKASWTPPSSTGGSLAGYDVKAYSGTKLAGQQSVPGDVTTATVTGLTNGVTYTVTVVARNGAGTSPAVSGTAVPYAAPLPPRATAYPGDTAATVVWSGANPNGRPITAYKVSVYQGTTWLKDVTVSASTTRLTVTGLANFKEHSFKVAASNVAGYGAAVTTNTVVPRYAVTLTNLSKQRVVTYGSPMTLYGRLTRTSNGASLGNRTVTITIDPDLGSTYSRSLTTDKYGVWAYTFRPPYNITVTASYAGDSTYLPARPVSRWYVASRVVNTSPASGSTSSAASTLTVTGSVSPNKAGRSIGLYLVTSSGNQLLARTTVASDSTFRFAVRLNRGTYTLKTYISGTPGNVAGLSAPLVVKRV